MAEKYLGYVTDKIPSNDESKGASAILKVIAIKENGNYRKLSSSEAKQYCSPNGQVFGPQFFNSYNSDFSEGTFIEFETRPNQEPERKIINQTDFIVNYTPRPKAINLPRLVTYNGKIKSILSRGYLSPDEINATIDKEDVFGEENTKFFLYDSIEQIGIGFFKYQKNDDIIESNYGKTVQEFKIPNNHVVTNKDGKKYLLFNEKQNILERENIIDFMTNQQLADWLKTKIKNIASVDKNTLSLICSLPEIQSAEDDREASRFERLKNKIEAFEIDIQTLAELIFKHPQYFSQLKDKINIIEKEIKKKFEKKYFLEASDTIKENQEKIKEQEYKILKLDETLKTEIAKISEKAEKVKLELEKENEALSNQIENKSVQLKKINENYDSVIATILALPPVLNTCIKPSDSKETFEICRTDFPKGENSRPYSEIQKETEISFVRFLKQNVGYDNERLTEYLKQVRRIFSHRACFIPNAAVAYLLGKALRNTHVMIIHVEYDWLHYSDFLKHGLLEAFKDANENSEKNYILVLDGLNVTQPECGLRPLLNLINGDVPTLDGCDFGFPNNMTVMATVLPATENHSVGLKLNPAYYNNWFAVGNPSETADKIPLPEDFWNDKADNSNGYVEPADLKKETAMEKAELLENYLNF